MKQLVIIILLIPVFGFAQTPKLNIRLQHNSSEEFARMQQIQQLAKQYDLSKYTITRDLMIDRNAINHSSPVLTLNLMFRDNDDRTLSLYLHEQAHWLLMTRHHKETPEMFAELTRLYPNIEINPPYGDGNRRTSYLHLPVLMLAWQALEDLIGVKRAQEVMKNHDHYKDLFATVIKHRPEMEEFLKRYRVKW